MKKALNAWSVSGDLDFEGMFSALFAAGFEGIELNLESGGLHSLTMETGRDELKRIKELSEKFSLPVHSISSSLGGKTGSDDANERAFQKEAILRQIEFARELGADGILTVPGGMSQSVSLLAAHENSLRLYDDLKRDIEAAGVYVGVENVWNGFFTSPFHMKSFIEELSCPYIKAYLDVGNMVEFSVPVHWVQVLSGMIVKVHIKDFKRARGPFSGGCFVNLLEGDVNWAEVIPALRKAGYDGYLTAELEPIRLSPEYLYGITSKAMDIIINL